MNTYKDIQATMQNGVILARVMVVGASSDLKLIIILII